MKLNFRRKNSTEKHEPNRYVLLSEKFIDGTSDSTMRNSNSCNSYHHSWAHQKKSDKHFITKARRRANKNFIRQTENGIDI